MSEKIEKKSVKMPRKPKTEKQKANAKISSDKFKEKKKRENNADEAAIKRYKSDNPNLRQNCEDKEKEFSSFKDNFLLHANLPCEKKQEILDNLAGMRSSDEELSDSEDENTSDNIPSPDSVAGTSGYVSVNSVENSPKDDCNLSSDDN